MGVGCDVRTRTTLAINLTGTLQSVDNTILPAMYSYVARDFGASPSQMAAVTMARTLTQALTSPISGVLGYYFDRMWIIFAGCGIWALMCFFFGVTTSFAMLFFLWAVNGFGISLVFPNSQSVIADYFPSRMQGKAFGAWYMCIHIGAILGGLYATNMATKDRLGIEGWRFVMINVAISSFVIGLISRLIGEDPRNLVGRGNGQGEDPLLGHSNVPAQNGFQELNVVECREENTMHALLSVLQVPSLWVIVLQGSVGTMPWRGLLFATLYLQLIGMSDFKTSIMMALFNIGGALGAVLGGHLGDLAAKVSPNHGRIVVCQFSVFSGIPFAILLFKCFPRDDSTTTTVLYGISMFLFGLCITWPASSCNGPTLSNVVIPSRRSLVYAFDGTLEEAFGSIGVCIVGYLADHLFGFGGNASRSGDVHVDHERANALGNALVIGLVVPWALCGLFYCFLHVTYPKDKAKVEKEMSMSCKANDICAGSESITLD